MIYNFSIFNVRYVFLHLYFCHRPHTCQKPPSQGSNLGKFNNVYSGKRKQAVKISKCCTVPLSKSKPQCAEKTGDVSSAWFPGASQDELPTALTLMLKDPSFSHTGAPNITKLLQVVCQWRNNHSFQCEEKQWFCWPYQKMVYLSLTRHTWALVTITDCDFHLTSKLWNLTPMYNVLPLYDGAAPAAKLLPQSGPPLLQSKYQGEHAVVFS